MEENMPIKQIIINPMVIECMFKHGESHPDKEVAGMLIGTVEDGIVKIIESKPTSIGGAASVKITPLEVAKVAEEIEGTGYKIVGWYHTHPGFGCFMSSMDVESQSIFLSFNKKFVAIVLDPIKKEMKAYCSKCILMWFMEECSYTKIYEIGYNIDDYNIINQYSLRRYFHFCKRCIKCYFFSTNCYK